ncbi:LPXTG cell wall anchor domain-containing protein [Listeria newyorkensis]|uniref:LPXTG cell wall anchor domain-containing protein n=1 Tax=Listeria newyorkensis TaxID=1497681 RepID=A0A841YYD5_9LIST|nr:LPXTG cell wall anchor domain-containing protein [Listeria newyorkensis]MBC1457567.1 LPXTG cell wall anchor domain-containing protein [Listeria newyorkensis]
MTRRGNSGIGKGILFVVVASLVISGHSYVEATTGKSDMTIRILEQPKQEVEGPKDMPRNDVLLPVTGDVNNSVFLSFIGGILILFGVLYLRKLENKRAKEVN